MEYDSYEFGVDIEKQRKEITLPINGKFKIIKYIPKKIKHLINNDNNKWLILIKS